MATMKDALAQQFRTLITNNLGLQVREQDQQMLWHKIAARTAVLGLSCREAYYQLLTSEQDPVRREAEWQELACLLTVNESYFLRDQGQFSLLKHTLLPELIQHKREQHNFSLRIWSAGCSTGEEAYSLAVLLTELIPDLSAWDLLIVGTDLNSSAIARARKGCYSDWSFRLVSPEFKKRYFRRYQDNWEILPQMRQMVTFQLGNLVQDTYPNSALGNVDLILCRNVFIYFDDQAIATVLNKFHQTLAPAGYLITGHTELQGHSIHQFQVKSFPESVVYQRKSLAVPTPLPVIQPNSSVNLIHPLGQTTKADWQLIPINPLPVTPKKPEVLPQPGVESPEVRKQKLWQELEDLFVTKAYMTLIQRASEMLALEPQHLKTLCLLAETYANLGDHENAIRFCQQALQSHPLSIEPCYLLAQIQEEQGDLEQAILTLKRIIYLAPESVLAYLELGSLYERLGNSSKAVKQWQSALQLLNRLPPDVLIDTRRTLIVGDLRAQVERTLQTYE